MRIAPFDARPVLTRTARLAGLLVAALGTLVLVGWARDLDLLKQGFAGPISMKPNAAAAFLAAGLALWLRVPAAQPLPLRGIGQGLAFFTFAIGLLTLFEHASGVDLGVDQMFFQEAAGAVGTSSPGRMGPIASASFVMLGLAILLLDVSVPVRQAQAAPRGWRSPSQYLALVVHSLVWLPLVGYTYGVQPFYGIAGWTGIASHTAVGLLVLSLGVLGARPGIGFVSALLGPQPGAVMGRRVLAVAILLPYLLGWVMTALASQGWFDPQFGISLFVLLLVVLFANIVLHSMTVVDSLEGERRAVDEERVRLLTSERAARADLERAVRARDDFLGTVSHELRTPLNAILGWANLLRMPGPGLDPARGLEAIERNARLQARLIDDLLDLTRIQSGKLHLEQQPVPLALVAGAAVDDIRPAAAAKGLQIERPEVPGDAVVIGDPARLQQIVSNLLTNAVKYTNEGGHVRVGIREEGGEVVLEVSDDGEGIDPTFLPHVFGQFRQADGSITRARGGLGLGLALVRHLVELHGGRVEVASEGIGRGATFTVRLPAAPEASARATASGLRFQATDLPPGLRVLVVDDDPDAREVVRRVLEERQGVVTTVDNGRSALEILAHERFDLLISDIGMPGVDGYQLARAVRVATEPVTRAIAVTAYGRPEDRTEALQAGFDGWLPKPLDATRLVALAATLCRPAETPPASTGAAGGERAASGPCARGADGSPHETVRGTAASHPPR